MLSISVPLALVAMVTMPFVFLVGVKMRKTMFPVSWIIQARSPTSPPSSTKM